MRAMTPILLTRVSAFLLLLLLGALPASAAPGLFDLGPGGRTIAGPGREKPTCRNVREDIAITRLGFPHGSNDIVLMEGDHQSKVVCLTLSNEGQCDLEMMREVITNRVCNDVGFNPCPWYVYSSVPPGGTRALCARTGSTGELIGVRMHCTDVAPDALEDCPFSWRIDDDESR